MLRKLVSLVLCFALFATPNFAVAGTWDSLDNAWAKTKSATKSAYDATADKAKGAWDKTTEVSGDAWAKTSEVSGEAYDATAEWCGDHKEEIAGVVVFAIAAGVAAYSGGSAPEPKSTPNYSGVKGPSKVAAGKPFSQATKTQVFDANRARNNGVLRSDLSGTVLQPAVKHVKGYTPPTNEAHVDHVVPRSLGGTNSPANAQVLSRSENLSKGASTGASK